MDVREWMFVGFDDEMEKYREALGCDRRLGRGRTIAVDLTWEYRKGEDVQSRYIVSQGKQNSSAVLFFRDI